MKNTRLYGTKIIGTYNQTSPLFLEESYQGSSVAIIVNAIKNIKDQRVATARRWDTYLPGIFIKKIEIRMQPLSIKYSNDTAPVFKGYLNCIVSWASNDLYTFGTAYYYFCFPVPEKIPNELALYIALKGLRITKKSKIIDDIFVRDLSGFNAKFRKGEKVYHLNKEFFFKKIKQTTIGYKILD